MKPTVVFTNFWDANILAQDKHMTFCFSQSETERKYYMIWLRNFQVYSIALGIPDQSKIPFLKDVFRINHFCPTYDLLATYKKDNDLDKYKKTYRNLLISRKEDIESWINGLDNDKVYILCCWEDTSKGCNCHRQLLYDALRSTRIWKDKATWIYRHGNSKYARILTKSLANGISPELDTSYNPIVSTITELEFTNLTDGMQNMLNALASSYTTSATSAAFITNYPAGFEDSISSTGTYKPSSTDEFPDL